ncbi:DUF6069 family protein [Microbacterium sp. CCNWLW134]|uniref:DUF6069 family protein n=1 Tax=Microbacterium sp. CCNWLW134 TaxID=3122064 RepID=UPI00300FF858
MTLASSEARPVTRVRWARAGVAILIATASNLLIALAAAAALDAGDFTALQPGPVITVTVLAMILGTLFFAVLARLTRRARGWFVTVALAAAVASLVAPISLAVAPSSFPGATTAAALALIPLHLIPAAALVVALIPDPKEQKK